ncbi:hypothetical protein HHI36_012493 [Cryptolaemus montrouzieri]|uniref:Uncharacterized protein n=1 Tax=Cryptolaemus montrouzieri TaxID=559131 RepID=A0ABD2NEW1_9CUCU
MYTNLVQVNQLMEFQPKAGRFNQLTKSSICYLSFWTEGISNIGNTAVIIGIKKRLIDNFILKVSSYLTGIFQISTSTYLNILITFYSRFGSICHAPSMILSY